MKTELSIKNFRVFDEKHFFRQKLLILRTIFSIINNVIIKAMCAYKDRS